MTIPISKIFSHWSGMQQICMTIGIYNLINYNRVKRGYKSAQTVSYLPSFCWQVSHVTQLESVSSMLSLKLWKLLSRLPLPQ